jgi:hypothetical protein
LNTLRLLRVTQFEHGTGRQLDRNIQKNMQGQLARRPRPSPSMTIRAGPAANPLTHPAKRHQL